MSSNASPSVSRQPSRPPAISGRPAPRRRVPARLAVVAAIVALLGASFAVSPAVASPADSAQGPEVSAAVHSDVSPPLRMLTASTTRAGDLRERPLRLIPSGGAQEGLDPVVQASAGPAVASSSSLGFAGIGVCAAGAGCYAPPDTNGAVGATQYVQWVNTAFAVFDKSTGALATGFPKAGNAPWAGFGSGCETNNDGDPIVQYDKAADRWILTQFSVSTLPYLQCVAVSTSSDAAGSYYRYAFSYGNTQFPDYPKLGVWPDGYYMSFNIFNNGTSFAGAKVCALDRAHMLTGAAAIQQCFQLSNKYGGLLPSDLDGTTPPPANSPNFLISFGSNSLNLWKFHVDWTNSANTTLQGPINIPVASFSRACGGGTCVPQPNTSQQLDSLGDRLMYRLAYRNLGGHEALVVNHSVSVGGGIFSSGIISVRWYELRNPSGSTIAAGTPVVYQQGTLGTSDSIHRWMGSIAMDGSGDIALGYSASSTSVYPSVRYTGRTPDETTGTMETETIVKAGAGSQTGGLSRWGDYSAMTVDPVDDCTFWYTSEFLPNTGSWNWSTWITSFKFPGCSTTPLPAPTVATIAPASGSTLGGTAVTLSGTGFQSGATATVGGVALGALVVVNATTITGTTGAHAAGQVDVVVTNPDAQFGTCPGCYAYISPPAPTAPTAPLGLTASTANGKGVQLTWNAPQSNGSSAITGYNVYRATSSGTLANKTLVASLGVVTSYKDTATVRRTVYYYMVTAVNPLEGPPSNEASATAK